MVAGDAGVKVAAAGDGLAVTSGLAVGVLASLARGMGLLGGVAPGSRGAVGIGVYGGVASGLLGFGKGAAGSRGSGGGVPRGALAACAGCCCGVKLI